MHVIRFTLALCCGTMTCLGQPAMSRGQQQLPINYNECLNRARQALRNVGFTAEGAGNFAQGFKEASGAYIICNEIPGSGTVVNIVVATISDDAGVPGYLRQLLQAQMDRPGAATPPIAGGGRMCTPVGTWAWVDDTTVMFRPDGTVTGVHRDGSFSNDGRWTSTGGNRYRVNWRLGDWVDTLALWADGRAMDGTNNVGRSLHVTCQSPSAGPTGPAGGRATCTPVGTWDWVDGDTVVIRQDGTAAGFHRDGSSSNDGQWTYVGGNRYRVNWRIGGWVDTLTLSADGRSWDGTNNVGRAIHVTCRNASAR